MDTKDIGYFEMVYNEQSINKAAQKLYISPQGLGKVIKKIESELGTELFQRTAQGVIPTESGILFHKRSAELVADMKALGNDIAEVSRGVKRLRVGFAMATLRVIPSAVIYEFRELHPDVDVSWNEYSNDEVREMIKSGDLDYGFFIGESEDKDLAGKLVSSVPTVILVRRDHKFAGLDKINLKMLDGESIVTMGEQFQVYRNFISACTYQGFKPDIEMTTSDVGTMIDLCMQGVGLALAPDYPAASPYHSGLAYPPDLVAISFEDTATWNVFGACNRAREKEDLIVEFQKQLNKMFKL